MVALKFSVILFFLSQSRAEVHCDSSKRYVQIRENLRGYIDLFGSIYSIVDFYVLKNYSTIPPRTSEQSHFEFLTNFDITLKVPVTLAYSTRFKSFDLFVYSNQGDIAAGKLNLTLNKIDTYQEYLKSENCTTATTQPAIILKDNWSDPHCFLMFACEVFKSSQKYHVKKRILILADKNHNRTMINRYLIFREFTKRFMNFTEFGEHRGMCVCDKIAYYLNDCDYALIIDDLELMLPHFGIILISLIGLYFVHEIYCFIMEN